MKFLKQFNEWWKDIIKKIFIRNMLKKKMKLTNPFISKNDLINKQRLNNLINSIFKASKIVEREVAVAALKQKEFEDDKFLGKLKSFIDEHYGSEFKKLSKENEKLYGQFVDESKKLGKIKEQLKKLDKIKEQLKTIDV